LVKNIFFFAKLTYREAAGACKNLNMKLFSPVDRIVPSKELYKINQLLSKANFIEYFQSTVWTSGSNEGGHCVEDTILSWCSDTVTEYYGNNTQLMTKAANLSLITDRCVLMNFSTFSLSLANCASQQKYACEVRNTKSVNCSMKITKF
jgi:hypothetical protein